MTTTVTVEAHCSGDKEVIVRVMDIGTDECTREVIIQNGEKAVEYAYDSRIITVHEVLKKF